MLEMVTERAQVRALGRVTERVPALGLGLGLGREQVLAGNTLRGKVMLR